MNYKESNVIKNNMSKLFLLITIIISIVITFIILFEQQRNIEYKFIFLIPLTYILLLLFFSKLYLRPFYKYGPLFFTAQIFIFIRYVLTPLSMIIVEDEFLTGPTPKIYEMNMAIALMIYELICIFVVIYITMSRNKKNEKRDEQKNDVILNNKFLIGAVTVVFGIILINFPNSILPRQLLFIDESFTKTEFDTDLDGAISIISMLFKCMAFLLLISLLKKNDTNRISNFSLSFLILVLFMATFTGTSRWTLIFMGLTGLIIIERLYPKYKQFLRISAISILVTSVISISMYNFGWVLQGSETPVKDILQHMSTQFQVYFSGPRPVAQSLNIKSFFPSISIATFINDFLGSVPYVSNFIDQSDRINYYYNLYNYRKSPTLIMPLVGIGYTYFGFLLAPLFTVIAQWAIIKLDKLSQAESNLEFVFIYLYFGFRLTMSMGLSTQSLFSSFLIPTIPLFVLFALNKKVVFSKRRTFELSKENS